MKKTLYGEKTQNQVIIIIFAFLIIGAIIGLFVSFGSLAILQNRAGSIDEISPFWDSFRLNFTIDTLIICMNISLLLGLLLTYKKDYKKTKSPFLLGLVLFLLVLFVQSLLSLPILNLIVSIVEIGRQGALNIFLTYKSSIFGILSHFFETVALIILFYLSRE
ncbi:MAG TPA: hypothetical protein VKP59_04355 [Candidatus Thermoplasmatota archaeon]|nr:hypothetical protein [Candidatus Thermoplasmatota archaeon]